MNLYIYVLIPAIIFGLNMLRSLKPNPKVEGRDKLDKENKWVGIEYFTHNEFDSPDVRNSGLNMDIEFIRFLDKARKDCGIPFHISAGFRTPIHNANIKHNGQQYSAKNSPHMYGYAADISFENYSDARLAFEALLRTRHNYFTSGKIGIGFYGSGTRPGGYFIHVDNRKHRGEISHALWFSDQYNIGQYRNIRSDRKQLLQSLFNQYT